eukprot:118704-Chlamydomonas_euryale.AAC.1
MGRMGKQALGMCVLYLHLAEHASCEILLSMVFADVLSSRLSHACQINDVAAQRVSIETP